MKMNKLIIFLLLFVSSCFMFAMQQRTAKFAQSAKGLLLKFNPNVLKAVHNPQFMRSFERQNPYALQILLQKVEPHVTLGSYFVSAPSQQAMPTLTFSDFTSDKHAVPATDTSHVDFDSFMRGQREQSEQNTTAMSVPESKQQYSSFFLSRFLGYNIQPHDFMGSPERPLSVARPVDESLMSLTTKDALTDHGVLSEQDAMKMFIQFVFENEDKFSGNDKESSSAGVLMEPNPRVEQLPSREELNAFSDVLQEIEKGDFKLGKAKTLEGQGKGLDNVGDDKGLPSSQGSNSGSATLHQNKNDRQEIIGQNYTDESLEGVAGLFDKEEEGGEKNDQKYIFNHKVVVPEKSELKEESPEDKKEDEFEYNPYADALYKMVEQAVEEMDPKELEQIIHDAEKNKSEQQVMNNENIEEDKNVQNEDSVDKNQQDQDDDFFENDLEDHDQEMDFLFHDFDGDEDDFDDELEDDEQVMQKPHTSMNAKDLGVMPKHADISRFDYSGKQSSHSKKKDASGVHGRVRKKVSQKKNTDLPTKKKESSHHDNMITVISVIGLLILVILKFFVKMF